MPARDGTGPWGAGPRTGGGRGWCAVPRGAGTVPAGFGFGRGWRGRGFRCGWVPWGGFGRVGFGPGGARRAAGPLSREEELRWLKGYTADLEQALEQARKSMAALEQEQDR